MLTRRHINVHDDELCVMCEIGSLETINHLFFIAPLLGNVEVKFSFNGILAWELRVDFLRVVRSMAYLSSQKRP
jgi:hypothetical protein